MTNEKMTIHKALAELKIIDARINNAIAEGSYVVANKHSNEKIGGKTINEYKEHMKASHQKVCDLIARRNAIKRAVVLSNANTKVKVGNEEFTVAEAIEMKNHGMEFKSNFLRSIAYQNQVAQNELNRNSGEAIEKRAEQYVLSVIQAQPKDAKMSVDSEAMKALRKDYINNNTYDLIDPLNVNKLVEELTNEINEFNTEVDAALSVSNALTVIEIEY
jgi:hypothetical protein